MQEGALTSEYNMTTKEAAAYMRVTTSFITEKARLNQIKSVCLPGSNRRRFRKSDLDEALQPSSVCRMRRRRG